MHDLTAKRTLVKSPPELWSEVSEVERLARHLGAFGEITITKLEPERTVSWEGERASGTVSIEPSGWGTKVTLSAQIEAEAAAEELEPEPMAATEPEPVAAQEPEPEPAEPDPEAKPEPDPQRKPGLFARLFGRAPKPEPAVEEPQSEEPQAEQLRDEPRPEPLDADPVAVSPAAVEVERAQAVLDDVLEALGSAHHRPFSRS